jgi:hypothetical protein
MRMVAAWAIWIFDLVSKSRCAEFRAGQRQASLARQKA